MGTALDTVNHFYDSTHNRKGAGLSELVAKDVTFHGPMQDVSGVDDFLAMLAPFLPFMDGARMLAQVEHGDDVCSIFELTVSGPKGEVLTLPVADWIRVEQGRVAQQHILFDPGRLAAFEM